MNKTIILSEIQSKALFEFYSNKIAEINKIIEPYLSERSEYEDLVKQLQGSKVKPIQPIEHKPVIGSLFGGSYSEYDATWSVPKKGMFILSKENKLLSTAEIFDKLLTYESGLYEKRRITMVLLSSGFADKIGKTLFRVGKTRGQYKFGLMEWKNKEVA